jgi:hypothetical protein
VGEHRRGAHAQWRRVGRRLRAADRHRGRARARESRPTGKRCRRKRPQEDRPGSLRLARPPR